MKELKYFQVRHTEDTQGFLYFKKENAEKHKNKLNKKYGEFYFVDEITLFFKDGE